MKPLSTPSERAKWPEKSIRAYRRKWREITGVNPPHEGNTTHEYALSAALEAVSERMALPRVPTDEMYEIGEQRRQTGSDAQGIYIAMRDAYESNER